HISGASGANNRATSRCSRIRLNQSGDHLLRVRTRYYVVKCRSSPQPTAPRAAAAVRCPRVSSVPCPRGSAWTKVEALNTTANGCRTVSSRRDAGSRWIPPRRLSCTSASTRPTALLYHRKNGQSRVSCINRCTPRMKKGRMQAGRVSRKRSVCYSRCEPDHQCDPGCPTSTSVCRTHLGEHAREHLPELRHPITRPFLPRGDAMQVMYEACAGLDVHKRTVVGCAIVRDATGQQHKERRTFSTMTPDLLLLRRWLTDRGVTRVAMESTGSHWKPMRAFRLKIRLK